MFSAKTISKNFFMAALPSALLLAACSNEDLLNAEQALNEATGEASGSVTVSGSVTGSANATSIQNVSTCYMVSATGGIHVICDGALVGVLPNGPAGTSGTVSGSASISASASISGQISGSTTSQPATGSDNQELASCSMMELENNLGYSVTCGEKSGVILNGKDGKDGKDGLDGVDGKDGTSCQTTPIPDGSGIYVICDTSVVAIMNGRDGKDGVNGVDGKDGKDGKDGRDGIDGTNGVNGTNGRDGQNGADGKDGVGCRILRSTDSTLTVACGTDTSTIKATVYNSYTNGNPSGTTFEPVIVYVSSSSRATAYSSAAQVTVNPQPAYSYSVEPGAVNGKCGTYYPGSIGASTTIYHGDSIKFQFDANETSSIVDILNSVYEWKFPGATTASYAARGNDGIVTTTVFYDSVGTFYPQLSINGKGYEKCSGRVTVNAAQIRNCACTEDTENTTETHRAWKLSGCQSYAPITSYTWDGVETSSADGLSGLAPYEYEGQTRVTLRNADNTVKEVACGYILDNMTGYTFTRPGTYYLTYMCNKVGRSYVTFRAQNEESEGMWVTSKTSAEVNYSTISSTLYGNVSYSRFFNASSNENASGSAIAFILKSGSFRVHCDY